MSITYSIDDRLVPAILLTSGRLISCVSGSGGLATKQDRASRFDRKWILQYLSCNKFNGYLEPGGNKGFSVPDARELLVSSCGLDAFDEFPALPDLTMPLRGGIRVQLG